MPRRTIDKDHLRSALVQLLRRTGPRAAGLLPSELGVSHATLSRLIQSLVDEVVIIGRGRATKYAARRSVLGAPEELPIFEVLPDGSSRRLGTMVPIMPAGFVVNWNPSVLSSAASKVFGDLPYFFEDSRPSGFLGRLVPKRHPELNLPDDVSTWSSDVCLRYLSLYGWNSSGSLILGDDSFRLYLAQKASPADYVSANDREHQYPAMAADLLRLGPVGSSAAGEQPKFLATKFPGSIPVIVKFSPPKDSELGLRLADLLICEHLALETIHDCGQVAAKSNLIFADQRVFLEVERFDRTPEGGRRGLFSLASLHAEFVGDLSGWSDATLALARLGQVDQSCVEKVRWLECFSQLIGNTDRHFGNLAFFAKGLQVNDLAPAYDILPMMFAPRGYHIMTTKFTPPVPSPSDATVWSSASAAAANFWSRVMTDDRVSEDFRGLANHCLDEVERLRRLGRSLP
jgi:HipA-like C-terminal domain